MRILVSGVSRTIGRLVAERLLSDPAIEAVTGLDARACYPPVPGMQFVRADARRPEWTPVLAGIDAAIYLDAAGWPLRRARQDHEAVLLDRALAFCQAARVAGVPKLVIVSNAAAYGRTEADSALAEATPVRGHSASVYARVRAQLADNLDLLARRWPETTITRLRTGWISGARHRSLLHVWGGGPVLACGAESRRLPVVHEEDVVAAVRLVIMQPLPGVVHAAADGGITFRDLAALLGRDEACRPLAWLTLHAWLRWRWLGARTPPDWFRALYAGAALDSTRLRTADWTPQYTPREAITAALEAGQQ